MVFTVAYGRACAGVWRIIKFPEMGSALETRQADAYSNGSAEATAAFCLALLAQTCQQLYQVIVHILVCVAQTAHVKLIYLTFHQALTNTDGFQSVSISCSIKV